MEDDAQIVFKSLLVSILLRKLLALDSEDISGEAIATLEKSGVCVITKQEIENFLFSQLNLLLKIK